MKCNSGTIICQINYVKYPDTQVPSHVAAMGIGGKKTQTHYVSRHANPISICVLMAIKRSHVYWWEYRIHNVYYTLFIKTRKSHLNSCNQRHGNKTQPCVLVGRNAYTLCVKTRQSYLNSCTHCNKTQPQVLVGRNPDTLCIKARRSHLMATQRSCGYWWVETQIDYISRHPDPTSLRVHTLSNKTQPCVLVGRNAQVLPHGLCSW